MYATTTMEENKGTYIIQNLLDPHLQTFNIKTEDNEEITLDQNTIILETEDGVETAYIPCVEEGQLVMRPIPVQLRSETEQEETDFIIPDQVDSHAFTDKIAEENFVTELDNDKLVVKREPKYVTYGGKVVRTVPIPEPDNKKSSRVAPNTYKKFLTNNRNRDNGLIRYGRKHLLVDQQIMIGPKQFKQQLLDSSDLVMKMEMAASTKKQMKRMMTGITKLFAYSSHPLPEKLRPLYVRNCTTHKQPTYETVKDMELLPVGYQVEIDRSKIKRITRKRRYPEAEEYRRRQAELATRVVSQADERNVQILIDAANRTEPGQFLNIISNDSSNSEEQQIVIIHDGQETAEDSAYTQKNIEVLLAAAAESRGDDSVGEFQHVFICDNIQEQFLAESNQQIIIVEEDENGQIFQTQTGSISLQQS